MTSCLLDGFITCRHTRDSGKTHERACLTAFNSECLENILSWNPFLMCGNNVSQNTIWKTDIGGVIPMLLFH